MNTGDFGALRPGVSHTVAHGRLEFPPCNVAVRDGASWTVRGPPPPERQGATSGGGPLDAVSEESDPGCPSESRSPISTSESDAAGRPQQAGDRPFDDEAPLLSSCTLTAIPVASRNRCLGVMDSPVGKRRPESAGPTRGGKGARQAVRFAETACGFAALDCLGGAAVTATPLAARGRSPFVAQVCSGRLPASDRGGGP